MVVRRMPTGSATVGAPKEGVLKKGILTVDALMGRALRMGVVGHVAPPKPAGLWSPSVIPIRLRDCSRMRSAPPTWRADGFGGLFRKFRNSV